MNWKICQHFTLCSREEKKKQACFFYWEKDKGKKH